MTPSFSRLAAFAVFSAVLLSSCSRSDNPGRVTDDSNPRVVQVAAVERRPLERTVTAVGSLAAHEQATLSIKVPGRLAALSVDLGSVVKMGDVIARVEPADYELRLRQAAAALAQARAMLGLPLDGTNDVVDIEKTSVVSEAKAVLDEAVKNRDRVVSLAKAGVSSQAEVDTTEAAYRVAMNRRESAIQEARTRQATLAQRRAELELSAKQLSDATLRAPFDGAIQSRPASLGEFMATGTPVVTLVRTDPLRLRLEVPEREALGVRAGQWVRVHAEGGTNSCSGRISRLSPAITEPSRMLMVEADIPNDGSLRPGTFVRAEIITSDRDEGLVVPAEALITFAGLEKVVVVRDGKSLEKTITTGRRGPGAVEAVSGLKAGERVVLNPGNLRTGQAVSVSEAPTLQTSRNIESGGP